MDDKRIVKMGKEIIVQFDFKITNKTHSLYDSYFTDPPKGVNYKKAEFIGINDRSYHILRRIYHFLRKRGIFPKNFIERTTNSLRKDSSCDIVHFGNHLGKTNKPCVADYETVAALIGGEGNLEDRRLIGYHKKLLEQKNLKFLLPIHNEALRSFNSYFGNLKISAKQKILYPVAFVEEEFRRPVTRESLVIFGGSSNIRNEASFYGKGGYETLLAFEKLAKKFPNFKFVYLGDIPGDIRIPIAKNILINKIVPLKELYTILNRSKLFLQPCYSTPAMMFLIAMWFKLPILTYDCWANKEYVNSENGVLIKPEKVSILNEFNIPIATQKVIDEIKKNAGKNSEKIVSSVSDLLKKEKLMKKMGRFGFKQVSQGKFSIKKRNQKMLDIYKETLK